VAENYRYGIGIDATAALPRSRYHSGMIYRFDDFQLNSATRELHRHDVLVALPARAFECLAYLIEHR